MLKSNGLHRPENLPVKFGFSPKSTSTNLAKKLPSQTLSQTVSHRDFQLLSQTAHVRSHSRKRVHTRLSAKNRTQRLTRRNRGPSLPRPQHGLVPSAKFLLVLHAFIYIHFPVHCEPSTPAEEKNLSKLPSQTLSQTIFHRVFQLLPQTAHVCFHSRKRVHTRLRQQDRTQRPTRRNTGLPDGAAITTLDTYCTFTNFPGPGVRTANFAAFGSWPGVLPKIAESLRDSDALMRVAVPRRRGPDGLRDLFTFVEVAACMPCVQGLSVCARRGVVSLPSARFARC